MSTLTVDDLEFELRGSAQRRTLQVTVDRGGELILYVPPGCDRVVVEEFVREKRLWIYKKLAEKDTIARPVGAKQYVNGEGFPYLGRIYRLLVVEDEAQPVAVKLERGRFRMRRSAAFEGRAVMVAWYTRHAQSWLAERVERFSGRVGCVPSAVVVRDLGYRWGSCGSGHAVYFHWKTAVLPPRIIEYVVVHELVHLDEPHHTPQFWSRVERALPDFADRKRWLAENGVAVDAF